MRLSVLRARMAELWEKWGIRRDVIPIFTKICRERRTRNCLSRELRIFRKILKKPVKKHDRSRNPVGNSINNLAIVRKIVFNLAS